MILANEVNSSSSLALSLAAETVTIVRYYALTILNYYENRKMINENGKI